MTSNNLFKPRHSPTKVAVASLFHKSVLPALQLGDLCARNVGNMVSQPSSRLFCDRFLHRKPTSSALKATSWGRSTPFCLRTKTHTLSFSVFPTPAVDRMITVDWSHKERWWSSISVCIAVCLFFCIFIWFLYTSLFDAFEHFLVRSDKTEINESGQSYCINYHKKEIKSGFQMYWIK